jgi:hypothetical protein
MVAVTLLGAGATACGDDDTTDDSPSSTTTDDSLQEGDIERESDAGDGTDDESPAGTNPPGGNPSDESSRDPG